MKYAEDLFPLGSLPDQRTPGAYIDATLARNLDVYAKKIKNDMHFLILITGNDSVGNGKSTLATQIGTYLTWKINQLHKLDNTFTSDDAYFNSKQLTQGSLEKPQYTVQELDEGDDLTTHGMKDLAIKLKRYFRKCRQLNQIVILILPSFFELPKFYALARSHCLINVKWGGEFERGFFDFYGPSKKKLLYLKGKREWDYGVVRPDFNGVFSQSYHFLTKNMPEDLQKEIAKYRANKLRDTQDDHLDNIDETDKKKWTKELYVKLKTKMPYVQLQQWAEGFDVDRSTLYRWEKEIFENSE